MTIVERLLTLATAYAEAAVRADRDRAAARSANTPSEKAAAATAIHAADSAVETARATLRADLRHALERPVYAVPDMEIPVRTWRQGEILIRALADSGERAVRVRYTPEQALATGAGLVAYAAITNQRLGGTVLSLLGTCPTAEPGTRPATGPDTPDAGRRA